MTTADEARADEAQMAAYYQAKHEERQAARRNVTIVWNDGTATSFQADSPEEARKRSRGIQADEERSYASIDKNRFALVVTIAHPDGNGPLNVQKHWTA